MSQLGLERTKLMMMILLSSPWKLHEYDSRGNKTSVKLKGLFFCSSMAGEVYHRILSREATSNACPMRSGCCSLYHFNRLRTHLSAVAMRTMLLTATLATSITAGDVDCSAVTATPSSSLLLLSIRSISARSRSLIFRWTGGKWKVKMSSAGYCHARFLLSAFFSFLFFSDRVRPQFVLVKLPLSCDHNWIRSGPVNNVR